jgi:hypothetical protein
VLTALRVIEAKRMKREASKSEHNMRMKVPITQQPVEAETQPPDIQRRINAGWLRLWRKVYPNTPPPAASAEVLNPKLEVRRRNSEARGLADQRPAAVGYLSRFLCVGFALALLVTGCAGPRPLKGGRAVTTHKPAGVIDQTLVQGENPSQATKQDQETVKVRTYTVPAGSRVEQPSPAGTPSGSPQPSTINSQPSPTFLISSPMPVVEREERGKWRVASQRWPVASHQ